jgi:hypothetical protein
MSSGTSRTFCAVFLSLRTFATDQRSPIPGDWEKGCVRSRDTTGREVVGIALKLALLFFLRPGELRKARWQQFDLQAAQWRIPPECMKARVQHLVPLSRQALELLLKLRTISGDSEYVVPSLRDPSRPLHGAALSAALRSLGFDSNEVTPHGFRATACTLLNELGWRSEAIERQMAHGTANDVRRHYNYAEHLPERRVMMQAWADYLDELRASGSLARSCHPEFRSGPLPAQFRPLIIPECLAVSGRKPPHRRP